MTYSYQERVVLIPSEDQSSLDASSPPSSPLPSALPWTVRLEASAGWDAGAWLHPFSKHLSQLLQQSEFSNVRRIRFQSSSSALSAHASSQRDAFANSSPSGISLIIDVDEANPDLNWQALRPQLLRYFVAPSLTHPSTRPHYFGDRHRYVLSLPTSGAAVASDAILRFFQMTALPCSNQPDSMGLFANPTALSNILVGNRNHAVAETTTASIQSHSFQIDHGRRSMWWDLQRRATNSTRMHHPFVFSQGVQYVVAHAAQPRQRKPTADILRSWKDWIIPTDGRSSKTKGDPGNYECLWTDKPLEVMVATAQSSRDVASSDRHDDHRHIQAEPKMVPIDEYIRSVEDNAQPSNNAPSVTAMTATRQDWSISKSIRRHNGMANGGRLETIVSNGDDSCMAQLVMRDVLPAKLVQIKWQTLQANLEAHQYHDYHDGDDISMTLNFDESAFHGSIGAFVTARLSPGSSLVFSFEYDPAFLPFQSFPGDPNRGVEIFPAQVDLRCVDDVVADNATGTSWATVEATTLYSNTVLLLPPVPDMSMPFNVTSLTCSLYAYVVGSIIALIVKKSSERMRYKLYPHEKPKSVRDKIKAKIRSLMRKKAKAGSAAESDDSGEAENKGDVAPGVANPATGEEHSKTE